MNKGVSATSAQHSDSRWQFTARQERVLASWLVLAVAGMTYWCGEHPWNSRGLVDIDQAPRIPLEFQLDINRAGWQELTLLPRIGEALSQRIVESREREGPFRRPEDLLRVRGIGPKTLARLRPFLLELDTFSSSQDQRSVTWAPYLLSLTNHQQN